MCLTVKKHSSIQIANKDIVVYKHLRRLPDGNYVTTYKRSPVAIGEIIVSELFKNSYNRSKVEFGLHSFGSQYPCVYDGKYERADVIVKCTIPKGSKYFVGTFCREKSYASNCLRYDEIIINDLRNY